LGGHRATDDQNPELLRGCAEGAGNFGVVVQAEFLLHPLERVLGGRLKYEGDGVARRSAASASSRSTVFPS
jgi:hypothetical protein